MKPGGKNLPGESDSYDFGSGAGFYLDATRAPWAGSYNMASYITRELPETVFSAFPELDATRVSLTGHSMGGHGALTLVSPFFPPHFCMCVGLHIKRGSTWSESESPKRKKKLNE